MQSTETRTETSTDKPIPADSFLALIRTHENSAPPVSILADQLAGQLEARAADQLRQRDAAHQHSRQMTEIYLAISELLNLLHDRIIHERQHAQSAPADLEPLAQSPNLALDEIYRHIRAAEERQILTFEAALRQWESERESEAAEKALQLETFQMQAQIEVNRLLRVMWLGTGLAAIGAGIALAILS